MNASFANKIAIVTGGGKGIGEAAVQRFLDGGASVGILDIDRPSGEALARRLGGRSLFVECDVAKPQSVNRAVELVAEHFGGVDILVNNAGIMSYGTAAELSDADWLRTMEINLFGAFYCARAVIPLMQTRGGGVIVNVASVQSFLVQRSAAAYATSKSALLGLTRSIAVDFAPGIRCVAVCPGTVDTPMLHNALKESADPDAVLRECNEMHLVRRIATAGEVAELILYLAGDQASFITGQAFRIDGGLGIALGGSKQS